MRIVSLLPSATELVFALGLGRDLVGVTDECDYPAEATEKPVVLRALLPAAQRGPAELESQATDEGPAVVGGRGDALHELDEELLRQLQPDVVLTGDSTCPMASDRLRQVLAGLAIDARVVSFDPRSFEEVSESFVAAGEALGRNTEGRTLASQLADRAAAVRTAASRLPSISVLALEWMDPPWVAGRWVPEMIAAAGSVSLLADAKAPPREVSWKEVTDAAPEVVLLMPRGYYLEEADDEARSLFANPDFAGTPAARGGDVFAVDAAAYFSRPGPRLADGLDILAWSVHPEAFPEPPAGTVTRVGR
jgi:iron complex transport system substrate-binding protein